MINIKCFICGGIHKLRQDKFPVMLYDVQKKGQQTIDRKLKGYVCVKCVRKGAARDHKLKHPELRKTGWKDILKVLSTGRGRGVINVGV